MNKESNKANSRILAKSRELDPNPLKTKCIDYQFGNLNNQNANKTDTWMNVTFNKPFVINNGINNSNIPTKNLSYSCENGLKSSTDLEKSNNLYR